MSDAIYGWRGKLAPDDTVFDRDVVATAGVPMTQPCNDDNQTVAALLRPAFDEIANAAGLDASPNFDLNGRWAPDGF